MIKFKAIKPVIMGEELICHVRSLTIKKAREISNAARALKGPDADRDIEAMKLIIAETAVTEAGERLFTGPDDPAIEEVDSAVLAAIFKVAQEEGGFVAKKN